MRRLTLFFAAVGLAITTAAQADPVTASVQQTLKEQGFYYGEITGQKDADTSAAIRRYQIRNGLHVTGDINAETQKSLGVRGTIPPPRPTPTPATARAIAPPPQADTSDLRAAPDRPASRPNDFDPHPAASGYAPGPRGLAPETSGVFDGTPYEVAPPDVQRRVMVGAQSLLARRGYYRSGIDGVYGPGMSFALRAFQSRFALAVNGRLDMDTLGALGLLPGQQAPGVTAPRQRAMRRPSTTAPNGEPVYEPR